ncbi:Ig domain-containing protein [Ochrobactrum sp. Marseille-Q0166]|uniref:Ig domain-containing protein n=1 Tax=Ochrobactrum sp. Marseille-Q0166 TaxID=2761105 RepID=UPI001654CE3D|nr:Ig domain-containing protein [Ochrobactrum sp. Marseille-Q0166]MBC8719868.1 putative Ig domain-containing protein [Ochrobactrum sp. Marseille-Q0166]
MVFRSSDLPAGKAGQAYEHQLTATGGVVPYAWSATGLPSGLSIDSAKGLISGTPRTHFSDDVTMRVTDANGIFRSQTATLVIVPATLAIAATDLPAGKVGQAYKHQFTATGGVAPYAWSATGLPAGLSIDAAKGTISGTPTVEVTAASITVTVRDAAEPHQSATLTRP